jgi:hypothetical protein
MPIRAYRRTGKPTCDPTESWGREYYVRTGKRFKTAGFSLNSLDEFSTRFDELNLDLFVPYHITIGGKPYAVYLEAWGDACFTDEELEEADDEHDLEDLAIDKSGDIQKEEGWDGFVYLYPDESGEDYGLTVFYRRRR